MISAIQAMITKVTTMSDHGLRIQVDTQEITPESKAELFNLHETLGWFFFHRAPISEINVKELPEIKVERGQKTPSERLRAVLYIYWEQNRTDKSFEEFYRETIEKYIESIKSKLI